LNSYPDLVEVVRKENAACRALKRPTLAAHRVDIELDEQLRFTASFDEFRFKIDEPAKRGGTGAGPPPLAYFLAGAATCLMTQIQKVAMERDVVIDSMKTIARGHFDRRLNGTFSEIIYYIELQCRATSQVIKDIAKHAEAMCYAHNTLKKSVHMRTNLKLNGEALTLGG
jgi:uncharacterized OsmC-like protein